MLLSKPSKAMEKDAKAFKDAKAESRGMKKKAREMWERSAADKKADKRGEEKMLRKMEARKNK